MRLRPKVEEKRPRHHLVPRSSNDDPSNNDESGETSRQIATKSRPQTTKPAFYRVILLNDDYTPMDFVVHILKKFFAKSEMEATQIMMQVHNQGSAVAGVFTHEVAETKVYLVNEYSKNNKHPLKCIMEKD